MRLILVSAVLLSSSLAHAATGSISLTDVSGLDYYINTNITFSTTSSASGAMSEASYVRAVAATTVGGGYEADQLNDAFDGYHSFCLRTPAYVIGTDSLGPCQTGAPYFEFYSKTGAAATRELGGRQVVLPVKHFANGIDAQRKVFVPESDALGRWLDSFTNTTDTAITFTYETGNNMGSDSNTLLVASSLGNVASPVEDTNTTWISTFQDYSGTTSSDPRVGHVLQGTGAPTPLGFLHFADGDDDPYWGFNLTVEPGKTVSILHFVAIQPTKAGAAAKAAALAALPGTALQGLTAAERATIVNFKVDCASLRDACNDVVVDSAGNCTAVPLTNTPCTDGNACTVVDRCVAGSCVGSVARDCNDRACQTGTCDMTLGCQYTAKDDNSACDDGNACTTEVCTAGACAVTPTSGTGACDDKNPCTDNDTCNGSGGCVGTPNAANACSDNNSCTDDVCDNSGACVSTANTNTTCSTGTCETGACLSGQCIVDVQASNGTGCTIDDPCSANDQCFVGHCLAEPRNCATSPNECTTGSCQPGVGCVTAPRATGTCDDGNPCTLNDNCSADGCSGTTMDCSALNSGTCVVGACENGSCVAANAPDGTTCDDGNSKTKKDVCNAGLCNGKKDDGCAAVDGSSVAALLMSAMLAYRARRRRQA